VVNKNRVQKLWQRVQNVILKRVSKMELLKKNSVLNAKHVVIVTLSRIEGWV
jgi:hypothetical protein